MANGPATLGEYSHFVGYHPYSASVANALAYSGARSPVNGKPYTEAWLAGLAGGVAVGYFYFDYEGSDPQLNIVTRNSFNGYGFDSICRRLGVVREIYQTTSEEKARENLLGALERGEAPLVWADVFSLDYEHSDLSGEMWAMQPLIVYSYAPGGDALIADRADVPLRVSSDLLDRARGVVKKERYKLLTLTIDEEPDLAGAAAAGIADYLQLCVGKPPAGSAKNWGLKALDSWRDASGRTTGKRSWHKLFPRGRRAVAALSSNYRYAALFWKSGDGSADRTLMAGFLDEAADVAQVSGGSIDGSPESPAGGATEVSLAADQLREAADTFRSAAEGWQRLATALLPDAIPALREAREILDREHEMFLAEGTNANEARKELWQRYERLKAEAETSEQLEYEGVLKPHFESVAQAVDEVLALEKRAAEILQTVTARDAQR